MTFTGYIGDNYCYSDENRRWKLGEFKTHQEAVAAAKELIDSFLQEHYSPGMTAETLLNDYKGLGDDPFITGEGPGIDSERFSAWEYAERRCEQICNQKIIRINEKILSINMGIFADFFNHAKVHTILKMLDIS